ncbi:MATE family efflux transporter [Puteibacter caeruleilacunae]|nr:MATE family efflux transporter [Puteibacter caeruleilacunae]
MKFKKEINAKEFFRFLVPSILNMLFIAAYIITDGYFVSRFVGSDALASVNLIIPVNSAIFAIGLMFAAGGGALISIKLGEGDKETASKYFSNLLLVAVILGAIISAIFFLFKGTALSLLGVNSELWEYADTYSFYTFLTFPLLIGKIIFAVLLRAAGDPKASLIVSVVGGVTNVVLDFLFIVILDMGIAGAGLATMLGFAVAWIYSLWYFRSSKSLLKFGFYPINKKFMTSVVVNGSSEMISELAIGFTALIFNHLCLKYAGNDGIAAISAILYVNLLVANTFYGFAMGAAPLISYYFGKKDFDNLNKVRKYTLDSLMLVSPILVAAIILGKDYFVSIFFEASNPAYDLAVQGLSIFAFGFLFIGYNLYGSAMFTALSNGKISALISFSKSFVIFSIIAYALPKMMGVNGIWLIMPLVELTITFMVFYLTRERRMKKYLVPA